ncbi:hypothetical protein EVAR_89397_1 [Eumeta japonica]|uniref:Uncharacterized protein n=1 Tax=Eumeta variegata TaxID=151549 RepID=A0A4C1XTM3_EUMVA|nr:hypothetical protein EVAR_89397_1 [Eumeta japonica]
MPLVENCNFLNALDMTFEGRFLSGVTPRVNFYPPYTEPSTQLINGPLDVELVFVLCTIIQHGIVRKQRELDA